MYFLNRPISGKSSHFHLVTTAFVPFNNFPFNFGVQTVRDFDREKNGQYICVHEKFNIFKSDYKLSDFNLNKNYFRLKISKI